MRVTRLVAGFEFKSTVARRSFWLMTFLFPLLILVLSFGNTLFGDLGEGGLEDALAPAASAAQGYVDQAGLIEELPPDVPPQALVGFASLEAAAAALERGDISGYYVIPQDYVDTGALVLVQEEFQPLSPSAGGPLIEYVLDYALTADVRVAAALVDPAPEVEVRVAGAAAETKGAQPSEDEPTRASVSTVADYVPIGVAFVLFFVIVTSSSFLFQSVTREKENRTAEVLLVSVRPRDVMLGKLIGLGGAALVQIVVWMGGSLLVLWRVVGIPDLASVGLTASLLLWLVTFVILGYVAYGSILTALGALVPSQREGSLLMFVVLVPLMVPLWLNFALIEDPEGALPVALSLFPLTAPVAMTTRLAAGYVPLWQPLIALAGLALTAYLFVVLGARVFRAGTLLSSESFSWRRARHAARGDLGRQES